MQISEFKVGLWSKFQDSEGVEKQRTGDNVLEQGGHVLALASSRTWQFWPCGSDFRVKNRRDYWTIDTGQLVLRNLQ